MKEEPNQPIIPEGQLQDKEFDFNNADMDDITFMYRNKAYGAYQLRKRYPRNMVLAFLTASLLFLLLINLPNIINAIRGIKIGEEEHNTVVELTDIKYVEAERHLPLAPEMPRAAPKKQKKEGQKPKVKLDNQVNDEPRKPVDLTKAETDTKPSEGVPDAPIDGTEETTEPATESDTSSPQKPVSTGEPQKVELEQIPSYSGGEKEMLRFIYANIRYPEPARDAGIEGVVIITFIVEKDGSISNVTIKQDIGIGCGNEAARVVRSMPKWVAGKLGGKPIRTMMTLPIEFKLLDENGIQ